MPIAAPYKDFIPLFLRGSFPCCLFTRLDLMRELLAPLVPLLLLVFITSIPHFFRTATGPDHYLFKGVPVCLLDSYTTVEEGGGTR